MSAFNSPSHQRCSISWLDEQVQGSRGHAAAAGLRNKVSRCTMTSTTAGWWQSIPSGPGLGAQQAFNHCGACWHVRQPSRQSDACPPHTSPYPKAHLSSHAAVPATLVSSRQEAASSEAAVLRSHSAMMPPLPPTCNKGSAALACCCCALLSCSQCSGSRMPGHGTEGSPKLQRSPAPNGGAASRAPAGCTLPPQPRCWTGADTSPAQRSGRCRRATHDWFVWHKAKAEAKIRCEQE